MMRVEGFNLSAKRQSLDKHHFNAGDGTRVGWSQIGYPESRWTTGSVVFCAVSEA